MAGETATIISLFYNTTQVVLWMHVFFSLLPQEGYGLFSRHSWKTDQYWDERIQFRKVLELAQYLQATDIILSVLKLTRNNPVTVFQQIMSRVFVIYMIFPYSSGKHFGIFMTVMCWSVTEVIRFIFYSLKLVNMGSTENLLAYIIGQLRYTLFIVLYPVGVTGELIC